MKVRKPHVTVLAVLVLVVLGATAIEQGGLRAADEDVAGNRDQMLARMLEWCDVLWKPLRIPLSGKTVVLVSRENISVEMRVISAL